MSLGPLKSVTALRLDLNVRLMSNRNTAAGLLLLIGSLLFFSHTGTAEREGSPLSNPITGALSSAKLRAKEVMSQLPLSFEPATSSSGNRRKFISRPGGYALTVSAAEAVFVIETAKRKRSDRLSSRVPAVHGRSLQQRQLRFRLLGANSNASANGIGPLPERRNYFIGNDPRKWRTDVPTFRAVRYEKIYPGIDLVYYGSQQQLEYDFEIAPKADPRTIRLTFDRRVTVQISDSGDLVLRASAGEVRQQKPVVFQEIDGSRRLIEGRFVLRGKRQVGFDIAAYDRAKPLVIDPTLIFSTYFGGSGDDLGSSIAVDSSNNIYLAGTTSSADLPLRGAAFGANAGLADMFVTKIDATGTNVIYSTYVGGAGLDRADGIAIDNGGNAYVVGRVDSSSINFPTTPGAFATSYRGGDFDGVVLKLNPQGNALVYSTYLGGEENDSTEGIAVDANGNAYVTGGTKSIGFPTTVNAYQGTRAGDTDAFLTKINSTGSALLYSTYLGGSGTDRGSGVAIDAKGNAYVAGFTGAADFPTASAFQNSFGGSFDAFVAKIDTNASGAASLVFSTYLGGIADDKAYGIAIDNTGSNVYVTGQTISNNFPVLNPAQPTIGGSFDAFIAKISSAGTKIYATYLGGSGDDRATGIAVNSAGAVYVTGFTSSANFPRVLPLQTSNGGGYDAFVAKLNPSGSVFLYSTYLGGSANENNTSTVTSTNPIAVDTSGNAYITGYTLSSNFPTASSIQPARAGAQDAFVVKISDSTGGNQIDSTDFFVHQQYLDFLNREPDPSGFAFWTSNITSCGPDAQCIAVKRVNVSAAFLFSIEFQQTAYLVERIDKAGFGSASGVSTFGGTHQLSVPIVRFNELLADTQQIGQGLIVGQSGWEQMLETNKQNFTAQFVQRSRFTSAFPTSMTPTQFVDKLDTNAGGVLSSSERAALIGLFGSATDASNITARAQALRQVAENQNFFNAEFNRAFVLMQYFGYLRRNPNELPDTDYSGYDFWLTKLNQFNGNFVDAEMVKAFITSREYRQRFGP